MGLKVDTIQEATSATVNLTLGTTGNVTVGGNFGVGTSSTGGYRVAIVGTAASSIPLYLTTDATNSYIYSPNPMFVGSTGAHGISFVTNNTAQMTIASNGIITGTAGNLMLVQGTSQASTSGTSIDFTGIPSWVKRITVMFNGVSVSGTSPVLIQLGSTTFTTTGYSGAASNFASATVATVNYTTGLPLMSSTSAAAVWFGNTTICNISGNNWVSSTVLGRNDTTVSASAGGYIALGGVLDRVRITTVNGTDTFDAGAINILYE